MSVPNNFQLEHATGWFTPSLGTSDYFNVCNQGNVGVPTNICGFQNPKEGNAYSGIALAYDEFGPEWYEFIGTELLTPLTMNRKYHISFYVSLAGPFSDYGVMKIGAYLSEEITFTNTSDYTSDFNPQITNESYLMDTSEWMKIEGDFYANGDEKYLTIGYYCDPSSMDTLSFKSGSPSESYAVYYYIDAVTVEESSFTPVVPNVITPNNDGINDYFILDFPPDQVSILNRWGNIIYESYGDSFAPWDGTDVRGNEVIDGSYFYIIKWGSEIFKGFVQVVR
jgi:gliding motility-associated-like protein